VTGGINIDRESGTGIQLSKNGTTNLQLWVDGGITTTKTTFNDDQLVTKAYVDDAIGDIDLDSIDLSGYLQKSGGTMTGELKIDRGTAYNHLLIKTSGTNQIKLGSYSSDEIRLQVYNGKTFKVVGYVDDTLTQLFGVSSTGRVTLNNVRTPTGDRDAATKEYVDYGRRITPPGLRFLFGGTGSTVTTGKFQLYDSKIKISATSSDGRWLGQNSGSDYSFNEGHRFSIYYDAKDGNGWRVRKTGTYNRVDYHTNDIVVYISSERNVGSFSVDATYYITLTGMF